MAWSHVVKKVGLNLLNPNAGDSFNIDVVVEFTSDVTNEVVSRVVAHGNDLTPDGVALQIAKIKKALEDRDAALSTVKALEGKPVALPDLAPTPAQQADIDARAKVAELRKLKDFVELGALAANDPAVTAAVADATAAVAAVKG